MPAGEPSSKQASLLGPGREFDLIRSFLGRSAPLPDTVLVGPGDDAAVVRGRGIVLSSDLSVEDVHFRRAWLTPEDIGYRAAAAALSDLAAMAARPIGILASLAIAERDAETLATGVMAGVRTAAEGVGAVLLGGDLTRSPGPLVLDVIAVGEADQPILRSGAQPGDEVWVTGHLGGPALAVRLLESGSGGGVRASDRFARPQPRIRESLWLAEKRLPVAMLDLSDGLGKDAGHLAAASSVRVVLELERIPTAPAAIESLGLQEALGLALSGGEDYELCFAARPGAVGAVAAEFRDLFGIQLTRVGWLEAGSGVYLTPDGSTRQPYHPEGFLHFGERA